MAVLEDLLQGTREWLKVVVPGLTDDQVIPADDKGPRPELPYLTVRIAPHDQPRHVRDERLTGTDGGGAPIVSIRGHRQAVAALQGFGVEAAEWLMLASLKLGLPEVQAQLDASGFDVVPLAGGITDISELIDTEIEGRYARDFDLHYVVETDPETQVEFLAGELGITLVHCETDPNPLVATLTTE